MNKIATATKKVSLIKLSLVKFLRVFVTGETPANATINATQKSFLIDMAQMKPYRNNLPVGILSTVSRLRATDHSNLLFEVCK